MVGWGDCAHILYGIYYGITVWKIEILARTRTCIGVYDVHYSAFNNVACNLWTRFPAADGRIYLFFHAAHGLLHFVVVRCGLSPFFTLIIIL